MGVPIVAHAGLLAFGADGTLGAFQAGAVLLVATAGVFAFLPLTWREVAVLLPGVGLVSGLVHAGVVGVAGAPALLWLVLAVGMAAAGMAAFGAAIGTSRVAGGVVAVLLLAVGMTALFWADDVARELPVEKRREARQAIVYIDLLLACAYGAADHDRLHDTEVYDAVPMASDLIEPPSPLPTGAVWLGVGLALAGAAGVVRGRRTG
ncbi:MAG: hypothetical protein QNJ98_04795 [Planctomycetota bacterium]|nr:hypothetical protein [Planctomycetota bacterium]